jgi:hypothetical protein
MVRVYYRTGKRTAVGVPWWAALPVYAIWFSVWLVIAFLWVCTVVAAATVALAQLAIEHVRSRPAA